TNNGSLRPGGAGTVGTLTITGNYVQGAGGALDADLQSVAAYDIVNVSGTATLNGTLNVNYLGGYTGGGGSHAILTYASRSGTFSTINDVNALSTSYGATSFALAIGGAFNIWINAA